MKRILFILLSLYVGVAYADWRFNPYTQRQDYYESTSDLYIATATLTNALSSEILRATTREDAIAVSTGIIDANKVNKSGDTMTGSLLVQSSITANAYYGDGSHLTGVRDNLGNHIATTTISAPYGINATTINTTQAIVTSSDVVANAYYGDGSHLTGISASGTIEDCADLSTVMTATHENSIYRYTGATTENYTQYKFYKIIKDGVPIIVDYKHNVAFSGGEIGITVDGDGQNIPVTTVDNCTYYEGISGWGVYDYFGNRLVTTVPDANGVSCSAGVTPLYGTFHSEPSTPVYQQFYKAEEYPFVINPMTTQGDIIVGNSEGDYSRLQKGEEGDVLKTSALFDKGIGWGKVGGYELPQATSSALGGIKADERTTETGEVKIDGETGKLYAPTNSGGGEIGDIGFAPLGIDESLNKRRYLNGQVISQAQFQSFTTKVKSAVALFPSLATTEANWQAEVTNSKLGQCGKFVIDDDAGTIRLPKVVNINGLQDLALMGGIKAESLPNITGDVLPYSGTGFCRDNGTYTGAFKKGSITANSTLQNVVSASNSMGFDASLSSLTYQDNAPVQQEAVQYPYYIQVATGIEETLPAIREYEINTPFFFGQSMYSDVNPDNASWLVSNGSYNAKSVYPDYYDWLLTHVDETITTNGGKVVLSTGTITDYDWVVNTGDETFRLPLLDGSAAGNGDLYFYVGDTVQDASLINAGAVLGQLSDKISRTAASDKELVVGWGMPDYSAGIAMSTATNTPQLVQYDGLLLANEVSNYVQIDLCNSSGETIVPNLIANAGYASAIGGGSAFVSKGQYIKNIQQPSSLVLYPLKGAK